MCPAAAPAYGPCCTIALLDHDDLLPPHALYEIAAVLVAHADAGIALSDEAARPRLQL